jgi:hypothetical protein
MEFVFDGEFPVTKTGGKYGGFPMVLRSVDNVRKGHHRVNEDILDPCAGSHPNIRDLST